MPKSNHEIDNTQLISLSDASEIYGFSSNYLRQLIHRKRLKAIKIGGVWLTTRAYVEEYIQDRKQRGLYRDDIEVDND